MSPIRLRILWSRIRRTLWFTPALYAVIALLVLSTAPLAGRMLPSDVNSLIGLDGVYDLLDVLSNSLLAVSIFSLGIMASSLQAAAGAATPRARPLLTEDRTAQNAISTFLGGFIYGIVGLVGLSTNYYGDEAKVILFLVTCAVIMAVIVALIRWVGRLSNLGDVSEVIDLVEQAADRAFAADAAEPWLGGVPMTELPEGRSAVLPDRMGFVQAINVAELARPRRRVGDRPLCGGAAGRLCGSEPAAPAGGTEAGYGTGRTGARLFRDRRPAHLRGRSALRDDRAVGNRLARALAGGQRSRHGHRRDRHLVPRAGRLGEGAGEGQGRGAPQAAACGPPLAGGCAGRRVPLDRPRRGRPARGADPPAAGAGRPLHLRTAAVRTSGARSRRRRCCAPNRH